MSTEGVELAEEHLDERTTLLAVRGEAAALDPIFLAKRLSDVTAENVVLDLSAARNVEKGVGDIITDAGRELRDSGRRLMLVSADPDFRQAVGLAAGEDVEIAETRDEALGRL